MAYKASKVSMIRYVAPVSAPLDPPIPFVCECTTVRMTASDWVTEFNKHTQSYNSLQDDGITGGSAAIDTGSMIFAITKFRAWHHGELTTFPDIYQKTAYNNVQLPSNVPDHNETLQWTSASHAPEEGLPVKRPNCYCCWLTKFKMSTLDPGSGNPNPTIHYTWLGFEDGYGVEGTSPAHQEAGFSTFVPELGGWQANYSGLYGIGNAVQFLTMAPNEDQTETIVTTRRADELKPGDLVLKCTNTEATMQTGTDCLRVTATGSASAYGGSRKFAHSIETDWPQNQFPDSKVRGTMMLENGVYILFTPNGGQY